MGKVWTKDAEREQLRKIAELIDETEPGSYIRMSFSGIIAMCEQNIAEDACNNMPDRLEIREKRIAELEAQLRNKDSECGNKILKLEYEIDTLDAETEKLMGQIADRDLLIESKDRQIADLRKQAEEWEQNSHDAGDLYAELEQECAEKDAEIIRLKAEIYDLMRGAKNNG